MNIKKLFSVAAVVTFLGSTFLPGLALAATPDTELGKAYEWAYANGITTKDTYEAANMTAPITRAEMAKMLSNYAKKFQEKTPDTSATCNFNDTASVGGDLAVAIVESCQLGIMGQGINAFRPYDTITRAEFGTALSRVLWDKTYEGGTPYYAGHLNALKAAGIMTVIANAESMKEVRGYVMLMLMRSENETPSICEETDVKVICAVEEAAEEYKDCPAACRKDNTKEEDNGEDEVVKSGDLAVSAEAAEGKKVLQTGISDMDTLTFKTSEEVEINKITLERYGYNSDGVNQIKGIWLEDQDGNVIADAKTLSKDKVTLSIKKDYRKVDGEYVATIVIQTAGASLGTIGLKVTDVDSSAKNLNVDKYDPYTYEIINYTGAPVTVEVKGTEKSYNYEEGKSYEIARLKVKATTKDVLVKGFTLTNKLQAGDTEKALDMKEFLDDVTITVDSKEIKAKASVNKNDELVVTLNEDVEIAMNKSALFVLSANFKEFDAYGDAVRYEIAKNSDFNAVEKKNGTRVELTNNAQPGIKYVFAGGKIKLANTRLGNVDAAQASEGIVVAEGEITTTEPISKMNFTINVKNIGAAYVDKLTMVVGGVNGDDYEVQAPTSRLYAAADEAKYNVGDYVVDANGDVYKMVNKGDFATATAVTGIPFNFTNVDIEKSGKIQFKLDVKDPETAIEGAPQITFVENFGKAAFNNAKYENTSNRYVEDTDVAGSINFSKVTIQPAKASLNNSLTKNVEFLRNETNTKVVLEGEYTAKKGDIDLNKFYVTNATDDFGANKPTFYLYIDDMKNPVADTDTINLAGVTDKTAKTEPFSDVTVKAGETVKVKVEAQVEAYAAKADGKDDLGKFTVVILGTDSNNNEDTGRGAAKTVTIKVVDKGSVTVSGGASKNTVLKKAAGEEIASFTIKPSKGSSEVELEDLIFTLKDANDDPVIATEDDLTIKVGTSTLDDCSLNGAKTQVTCSITNETLGSEGKDVSIVLDEEVSGIITLQLVKINDKEVTNKFTKRFESALVSVESQENNNGTTTFILGVDNDDDLTITHLQIKFDTPVSDLADCSGKTGADKTNCEASNAAKYVNQYYDVVSDGDDLTDIKGVKDTPRLVDEISYYVKKGGDYDTAAKCTAAGGAAYEALPAADAIDGTAAGTYNYCKISILRSQYADFFKIGSQNVQAFASNK